MENKKNNTLSYRVGRLETAVEKCDTKIEILMTNDIPHLREDILQLKTRVNATAVINVGAIITGIVVAKLLL